MTLHQPTATNLIWGRRADNAYPRFRCRVAVVRSLISRWTNPTWKAADVSGGAGRWLSHLAPRFAEFSHLDRSEAALQTARAEHPDLSHVEYRSIDLLANNEGTGQWDALFCLDTLLYGGTFVETVLANLHLLLSARGVAILEFPSGIRARCSRLVKGSGYRGPQRNFLLSEVRELLQRTGYICLEMAFQHSELPEAVHEWLAGRQWTGIVPVPSTWTYAVVRSVRARQGCAGR